MSLKETYYDVPAHSSVSVVSDGPFTCYWYADGIGVFAGPVSGSARQLLLDPSLSDRTLLVKAESGVLVDCRAEKPEIEYPDPTPIEVTLEHRGSKDLQEQIKDLIARELATRARQDGFETLDEADDFVIDDQELEAMLTPYEMHEMVNDPMYDDPREVPIGAKTAQEPAKQQGATPPATPSTDKAEAAHS